MSVTNILNDYSTFVQGKCKAGEAIVEEMTPNKAHLTHMALGLAGEVGETVDIIKKMCMYNKEVNKGDVFEELGDVLFYLTGIANGFGFNLQDILQHNMDKLNKRYSGGYSDKEAIARADKA